MENRAHAIAVGLFTLLLLVATIFAYWWLSGQRQILASYTIVSKLPVTGLSVESAVKFRGVDVGKVTNIAFDPNTLTTIFIQIEVPDSLQLSQQTYAELRMQGITGLSYIDLNIDTATTDNVTKPNKVLLAGDKINLRPTMLDHLMIEGPKLLAQTQALIASTSQLSETANKLIASVDGQQLARSLNNLNSASSKISPMLDSATLAFNHVNQLTSDKNQQQLLLTIDSLKQTSDAVRPLIADLSATAKNFTSMTGHLEQNATQVLDTLNHETLPKINALTQTTEHELKHVDRAISIIEDNPQSLIFGQPAEQPGPGEAGFNR